MVTDREHEPARPGRSRAPLSRAAPAGAAPATRNADGEPPSRAGWLLGLQRTVGNAAVQRLVGRRAHPAPVTVSRFEGHEHRDLGDSTRAPIDLGNGVVLSWGQVVALAGDEFGSVEDLREAAKTEAGRGRILAALRHDGVADPVSVPWATDAAAEAAKEGQKDEFVRLAAGNAVHFAEGGALSAWQSHHRRAITAAVTAGLGHNRAGLQDAYLIEAFGEHFLTDLFSAGHIRTPRAAILAWYTTVFAPRVADAMLAAIKSRVTEAAVREASDQLPGYVPNSKIRALVAPEVSSTIDTKLAEKLKGQTFAHALGVGVAGVVSGMLHDKEGKTGIVVSSEEHPEPWTAYGDAALDKSGPSAAQAKAAIAAAKADVDRAFAAGEAGAKERAAAPASPPSRVHFDFGSAVLSGANARSVDAAAAHLKVHAAASVDVAGHTDPVGTDADNQALGLRRAQAVQSALVAAGVEPGRVRVSSQGEQQLVTTDPKRYGLNRRADLVWRSDPDAPHAGETETETATRQVLEQVDTGYAAGYPAVKRFVPRPVEERGGSGNAPLPEWHWGKLDAASRAAADEWIRNRAGSDVNKAIGEMEIKDVVRHVQEWPVDQVVTIHPKPIIEALAAEFLAAPTKTLGDLTGEPAGPE
jgi:outer membrane protein OmpA-like peptidoglycan-associated protein